MSEKDHFPLVPKSPAALEKAVPEAQRILSSMIADTLALAKQGQPSRPVFTVLRSKGPVGEVYEAMMKVELESRYDLRFIPFETEAELLKFAQAWPFDLAVLYLGNVSWTGMANVLLPGAWGALVDQAVVGLGRLRAQHGKPILASQGSDLTKRFEGTGVTFLNAPCTREEFRQALRACLRPSRHPPEQREVMSFPCRTRPPRIVMMDDLQSILDMLVPVVRLFVEDATILTFTDEESAFQELMREDPDLFMTDICHRGMSVDEVLARLTERQVKYPIFVMSTMADRFGEEVRLRTYP